MANDPGNTPKNWQFQRQINRCTQALAKLQYGIDQEKWSDVEQADAAEAIQDLTAKLDRLTAKITL